jgi:membrane-associated phospholipid phosphatase
MKFSVVIPLYNEVDSVRPIVDASSANPRTRWSPRWKPVCFGLWIVAGLICIAIDEQVQPHIRRIGQTEPIREVAKAWQDLGATWGIVLFLLAGVFCLRSDRGRTLAYFVTSVSMASLAVQTLKRIIGRVRPSVDHDTTSFLGPSELFHHGFKGYYDSMPSGHTAAAFAMAVVLAYRWPRLKWLWYGLALGVGVSRLLVDAHFPSDVILGACLGTLVGLLTTRWLIRSWPLENSRRAIMSAVESHPKNY